MEINKDVRLKPVTGDCMDCGATWYVGTDYEGTISRLKSENEKLKKVLEEVYQGCDKMERSSGIRPPFTDLVEETLKTL